MNSTCLLLSVCLSLPLVPSTGWCMQTYDFTALSQKIQEDTKKTPISPLEKIDAWVASQQEDGSWDDFEYGTLTISGANRHLWRLLEIAKVFTSAKQLKYHAAVYKRSIKKGLHFWEKSKTKDPNWWHNEINWPKQLGELLLLVQEFKEYLEVGKNAISQETLLNLFHPTTIKALSSHGNGANMFDYGLHYIYRAVLTEDLNLLCKTSEVLEKNIVQQLQPDLSFHEHGPQLHLASYGSVFQSAVVKIAYYLSDTPAAFDINSKPFSHFLVFVRTVLIPSIRGQYWDFNILGRSISRPNATKGKITHLNVFSETIDPENHKTYKQALQRIRGMAPASFGIKKANVHYWNSDYTQHRRRGFLFSIRNVSTRTVASETGNNENLKGHYLSYGANFLALKGDEYFNLMPAWDWAMIPGVTSPHTRKFPKRLPWGKNYGNTQFVGGVSANNCGAVAFRMKYEDTQAQKGWFMFDNEIVCLGNSITSFSANIRTTINQCHGLGKVFYFNGKKEGMVGSNASTHRIKELKWVRHNGIAYFFPESQRLHFSLAEQTGTWHSINSKYNDRPLTKEVFKLWIDHGNAPTKEKYAYILVPGITDNETAKQYPIENLKIIANNSMHQAVYHAKLEIYQIIFYSPGKINYKDFSVSVNIPCVLQVEQNNTVSIADPAQKYAKAEVTITCKNKTYAKTIQLPSGGNAGATRTLTLETTNFK